MGQQRGKKMEKYCHNSSWQVKLSAVLMGTGQICYGSIIKGILFLISEVSIVLYFVIRGWRDIVGFFTLGTQKGDAWLGIEGDNSVVMLLMGIFAWIVLGVFIMLYRLNLKDVCSMQKRMEQGKHRLTFREEIGQLLDKKFYILVLALPVLGV